MAKRHQSFFIKEKDHHEILQLAFRKIDEEVCGLIGGNENRAELIVPVENVYHSPNSFRMNDIELVKTLQLFEERLIELVAIFHSHPNGPEYPSQRDVKEFMYPGVVSLIITTDGKPPMQGYYIDKEDIFDVKLIVY